jgi:hypothetical protein
MISRAVLCLVALGGRGVAQEPREGVGGAVEDYRPRQEQVVEELHERGHKQRGPLGALDGDGLGRQLPEDDVQERDYGEAYDEGDEVERAPLYSQGLEQGLYQGGYGRLPKGAEAQG